MSYFEVRYHREGLTTTGSWIAVMDGGFVTEDCTLEEVKSKVAEIVGWHDGKTSRINKPAIRLISENERLRIMQSDVCFWSRNLSRMIRNAAERFRQDSY